MTAKRNSVTPLPDDHEFAGELVGEKPMGPGSTWADYPDRCPTCGCPNEFPHFDPGTLDENGDDRDLPYVDEDEDAS